MRRLSLRRAVDDLDLENGTRPAKDDLEFGHVRLTNGNCLELAIATPRNGNARKLASVGESTLEAAVVLVKVQHIHRHDLFNWRVEAERNETSKLGIVWVARVAVFAKDQHITERCAGQVAVVASRVHGIKDHGWELSRALDTSDPDSITEIPGSVSGGESFKLNGKVDAFV